MANQELDKRVYVEELKEYLKLTQLTGNEDSLNRWIIAPDVNRPGLELTGYLESNELKRVVVIGNKEYDYLSSFDKQTQKQRLEIITDSYTPCIIMSNAHDELESLIEFASDRNFPVFRYHGKTYQLIVELVSFLSEKLAPTTTLHGVMMNMYGKGILIMGKSGIGKSELALDLINRGHMLVADDCVDIAKVHDGLLCRCPELLTSMLEVRGLGIVDITKIFGSWCYLNKCHLDFIINLIKYDETNQGNRLNPMNDVYNILDIDVPMLTIPITEGKTLSTIVETAVTTYILKKQGCDGNEEFKKRTNEYIKKQGVNND